MLKQSMQQSTSESCSALTHCALHLSALTREGLKTPKACHQATPTKLPSGRLFNMTSGAGQVELLEPGLLLGGHWPVRTAILHLKSMQDRPLIPKS